MEIENAKLKDLYFHTRMDVSLRGQLGYVVDGGILGTDVEKSMMKLVDTEKNSQNSEKIEQKVAAYKNLLKLQGSVIPKVLGYFLVDSWIAILVLSKVWETITGHEFSHPKTRKQIRWMVQQIHDLGVSHGDLKFNNILVNDADMNLTIIDFSEATLHNKVGEMEFEKKCKTDSDVLRHLERLHQEGAKEIQSRDQLKGRKKPKR